MGHPTQPKTQEAATYTEITTSTTPQKRVVMPKEGRSNRAKMRRGRESDLEAFMQKPPHPKKRGRSRPKKATERDDSSHPQQEVIIPSLSLKMEK